ncbi:MAG: exodeoxyribonuclease VII large subunit [Gemmatimonadales bacterium]|nr:exodeoxyribonuclease VII large subunit [Gemmatimonadales bacterium]NIN12225.1 exodeoxyribonuclease VII large subunit [Gemmatimonadales bacterium]NIN50640.1 exodeoxyribonuclease VII large subunit [Gemmatimonadales bacterium]NIP08104.1 exodeoxyribonuclease VII large subunit [Gemmatimonadales bacterium]NIR03394.1 exodeoxyribonuclease VII large subunit [Gemmatimonadales bacterium]
MAQVTRRARQLIEAGFDRIWVRGEVTGLKTYRSGHWYFTLRDAQAQIRCVMWRSDNQRLPAPPEDGMEVFVEARPTVWEERAEFRLTVKELIPTAEGGLWQLQLERAKAALEKDGLLDPARKRPLPRYARRIAVVTSPDGAALRDIVSVIERRWPSTELWVVATRVQGEGAEGDICAALAMVNRLPGVDLAIVGRGGGSREDLWAFNSERVARAVAAVQVPTISAVGHETDVALTDLVADVRAPTPSAAAEAAVPDREAVWQTVATLARRLGRSLTSQTELGRERLERTADRLTGAMQVQLERRTSALERLGARLEALSPLHVLERGYAVARDEAGRVLKRAAQFREGLPFRLTLADGDVRARTLESDG